MFNKFSDVINKIKEKSDDKAIENILNKENIETVF